MKQLFKKIIPFFKHSVAVNNEFDEPADEYQVYVPKQFDINVIAAINTYREQKKLTKFVYFGLLSDVAYSHSEYMAVKGIESYDFAAQRKKHFPGNVIVELVACNYQTAESTVASWINSERGNEILLSDQYLFIGVATDFDGKSKRCVTLLLMD